jgi:hypothetical protein
MTRTPIDTITIFARGKPHRPDDPPVKPPKRHYFVTIETEDDVLVNAWSFVPSTRWTVGGMLFRLALWFGRSITLVR